MTRWRPIPGFRRYLVSDDGRIRRAGGREMKISVWGETYLVTLVGDDRQSRMVKVPHAVLLAFVGPCPEGMESCHYPDRDKSNNRLSNLRWDTPKENSQDRIRHGTQVCGEDLHFHVLTEKEVEEIRAAYAKGGVTQAMLAEQYGVYHGTIYQLLKGITWAHLPSAKLARDFSSRRGRGWKRLLPKEST